MIRTILTETNYKPRFFMEMVARDGATEACLRLVRSEKPSEGFTKLWELGRLDLTAEAQMLAPEFKDYFEPSDLELARKRLKAYGYKGH